MKPIQSLSTKRAKTIEVIGLCGAGKTTLLNVIYPRLEHLADFPEKILPIPMRLKEYIFDAAKLWWKLFCCNPLAGSRAILNRSQRWLVLKLGLRMKTRKCAKENSAFFWDTGVLQPFISYEIEERKTDVDFPLIAMLECLPLPDVVLLINVTPETAYHRYCGRAADGKGRTLSDNSQSRFIEAAKVLETIKRVCELKGVDVVSISTEKDITDFDIETIEHNISHMLTKGEKCQQLQPEI